MNESTGSEKIADRDADRIARAGGGASIKVSAAEPRALDLVKSLKARYRRLQK